MPRIQPTRRRPLDAPPAAGLGASLLGVPQIVFGVGLSFELRALDRDNALKFLLK